ncbi:transcription factor S-II, central domain-containing protein [Glomus cerebriforme]|uniref:Transcription factor S-II, central domain-containing protein n=1 Tax=Glomus cerebriforme TaxID=658196 RepID=A0A397SFC1_9GLOM|nr:transcription factor S-II, central domain-containing protein [Glomus cerebriforme]
MGPDLPIKYLYTGNGLKLFYQSLLEACNDKDNEITRLNMAELAKKIEESIFANTGSSPYDDKYKTCCRSKLWNLRDKRNSEFVSKVISGNIKAEDVYKLTGDEMLSHEKYYQKQIEMRKMIENSVRYESDLVPMKLESDGSLSSCMSGGKKKE